MRLLRNRGLLRGAALYRQKFSLAKQAGLLPMRQRTIAMLVQQGPETSLFLSGIERELIQAGYTMDLIFMPRHGVKALGDWARINIAPGRYAAWALCSVPRVVQQRAVEARLPALVLGSCFPGIRLPELDVDYRAVCRHATQYLLRLGRRNIVLVTPRRACAGDRLGEQGFKEIIASAPAKKIGTDILYYDYTPASLQPLLDRFLHRRRPPLAFLVAKPAMAMMLVSNLLRRGLNIPDQAAVIARDYDPLFAWHDPPIACYVADMHLFARRSARALLHLAEAGRLDVPLSPLIPRLVCGGTLPHSPRRPGSQKGP